MQPKIKGEQPHRHAPSNSAAGEEKPNTKKQSSYVVNNNFHTCIQPKRISYNLRLYLQVHQKLMRKGQTNYKFNQFQPLERRGFKGKVIAQTSNQFFVNLIKKKVKTKSSHNQQTNKSYDFKHKQQSMRQEPFQFQPESTSYYNKAKSSHSNPKFKYNLSLILKKNKKAECKYNKRNHTLLLNGTKNNDSANKDASNRLKRMKTVM